MPAVQVILSVVIVGLSIAVIMLAVQVQENNSRCVVIKHRDQEKITHAARLIVQSITQSNPLFAMEYCSQSKFIIDEIIDRHNGTALAEKNLNLPNTYLEKLRIKIYSQFENVQSFIMNDIVAYNPSFENELNTVAGLKKVGKKKSRK